ncbi:transcriptional regulator with XRE-family HTH domain [Arcanobacterium wilhelmae]|uniref:Transcriptional regulator with XRE-family HTH domain n=1 Tax=Arcanobacterium wilhelmae TaxID=1803177 RepID=A0ABT9NAS7_9ACTO|nr:helix-turn-helix domain-containing protein [Arcanobacterium wilhelmae]MDP9800595.1 transcriptional regulator with XRE-family HTH domain [Arcanobacterium wilhelmae]WFN90005.1 helix-turn-helix domain-containing protein [Arcanobacterium wilhelmae]
MSIIETSTRSARDLGIAVRDARLLRGLTQEELATRIGAPRAWLSQLENGKTTGGSITRILRTLHELGIDLFVRYSSENAPATQPQTRRPDVDDLPPASTNAEFAHTLPAFLRSNDA